MEQLKEKLTKTKLLGIIGAALTIIGVFLPFATVSASILGYKASQSVNFIEGDGVFVLILTIVALLMIFADVLANKVAFFGKLTKAKLVLIPTVISIIILIYDMANAGDVTGSYGGIVKVSYGIGTWIMWIGLIATAVYPFIYKKGE